MRVLICGSRDWIDEEPIRRVVDGLQPSTVIIHGAARGADSIAGRLAEERGMKVLPFPAKWQEHVDCNCGPDAAYCREAGPRRNKQMLDEGEPDIVYAFPVDIRNSRGTFNMIAQARQAGVKVIVHSGVIH